MFPTKFVTLFLFFYRISCFEHFFLTKSSSSSPAANLFAYSAGTVGIAFGENLSSTAASTSGCQLTAPCVWTSRRLNKRPRWRFSTWITALALFSYLLLRITYFWQEFWSEIDNKSLFFQYYLAIMPRISRKILSFFTKNYWLFVRFMV